nr:MAG TPA: holin family protein [Caudoviricetes sp.]
MLDFWLGIASKAIWAILSFICGWALTKIHKHRAEAIQREREAAENDKKLESDIELIKDALRHTLRNVLISDYDTFTNRGWCSHLEKEEYTATYATYHSLNGNGVVTHKNKEVLNLPDQPQVK